MNQQPVTGSYSVSSGITSTNPFVEEFSSRSPTIDDVNHPIQKRWFNKTLNEEWILIGFYVDNLQLKANWVRIATSIDTNAIVKFTGGTGTSGFPVVPDAVAHAVLLSSNDQSVTITGGVNSIDFSVETAGEPPMIGFDGSVGFPVYADNTTRLVTLTSSDSSVNISGSPETVDFSINTSGHPLMLGFDGTTGTTGFPVYADPSNNFITLLSSDGTVSMAANTISHTIDFKSSGGGSGFIWTVVSALSFPMAINNGYIIDAGSYGTVLVGTLPATCSVGDTFKILEMTGASTVQCLPGQTISMGPAITSSGGSISSNFISPPPSYNTEGATVELICTVADTSFSALNWVGNWNLT